jgi:hypothetical protein
VGKNEFIARNGRDYPGKLIYGDGDGPVNQTPIQKPISEMESAVGRLNEIASSAVNLRDRISCMRARTVGPRPQEVKKDTTAPTPLHHMAQLRDVTVSLEQLLSDMHDEVTQLETAI